MRNYLFLTCCIIAFNFIIGCSEKNSQISSNIELNIPDGYVALNFIPELEISSDKKATSVLNISDDTSSFKSYATAEARVISRVSTDNIVKDKLKLSVDKQAVRTYSKMGNDIKYMVIIYKNGEYEQHKQLVSKLGNITNPTDDMFIYLKSNTNYTYKAFTFREVTDIPASMYTIDNNIQNVHVDSRPFATAEGSFTTSATGSIIQRVNTKFLNKNSAIRIFLDIKNFDPSVIQQSDISPILFQYTKSSTDNTSPLTKGIFNLETNDYIPNSHVNYNHIDGHANEIKYIDRNSLQPVSQQANFKTYDYSKLELYTTSNTPITSSNLKIISLKFKKSSDLNERVLASPAKNLNLTFATNTPLNTDYGYINQLEFQLLKPTIDIGGFKWAEGNLYMKPGNTIENSTYHIRDNLVRNNDGTIVVPILPNNGEWDRWRYNDMLPEYLNYKNIDGTLRSSYRGPYETKGDPCKKVYPEGQYRTPNETIFELVYSVPSSRYKHYSNAIVFSPDGSNASNINHPYLVFPRYGFARPDGYVKNDSELVTSTPITENFYKKYAGIGYPQWNTSFIGNPAVTNNVNYGFYIARQDTETSRPNERNNRDNFYFSARHISDANPSTSGVSLNAGNTGSYGAIHSTMYIRCVHK
ncbi:HAD family hydrolase [Sphingobacterium bovistauri]|uniref:DUF4906 domain-containing protein n=1 Tax=Sphingobacterium bovistauri TaxID=2781959 RepID=A0ABS7Z7J9_9SPHI|nr:hypothetical protein [Sphingobacterium bovistauri]MCA5006165.1 hypothetical protein [Sphingobacterium bovistauri]